MEPRDDDKAAQAGPRTRSHIAVRLGDEALKRLDALIPFFSLPSGPATRSDVLRAVVLEGLEVWEARVAKARGPGGGA
jgi:hypothetical protein